jgi:hypothetical protein
LGGGKGRLVLEHTERKHMRNADITDIIDKTWREFKKNENGSGQYILRARTWKFFHDGTIEDMVWYGDDLDKSKTRLKWGYDPHQLKIYIYPYMKSTLSHEEKPRYVLNVIDDDILVFDSNIGSESNESKESIYWKRD